MTNKIRRLVILSLFSAALGLSPGGAGLAGTAAAADPGPDKTEYQPDPVLSAGSVVPEVLLVLSKDHKMFLPAYIGLFDLKNGSLVGTGFNPGKVYYGYFDSYSCYSYQGALNEDGDPDGYFRREFRTTDKKYDGKYDDDPQSTLDGVRAALGVKPYIGAARSATGICQPPHGAAGGYYSGNWLNYMMTTRMDAIRKILYGGFRQIDDKEDKNTSQSEEKDQNGQTILESSFMPNDAHVLGTDVVADDRWNDDSPLTPYYDISKYTPFPKPASGKAHFFARVRSFNTENYPTLRFVLGADQNSLARADYASGESPKGKGRYFDWVMDQQPNPKDARLSLTTQAKIQSLTARVEVCRKDIYDPDQDTEGCQSYRPDPINHPGRGNLKPVGLLQRYGDKMYFGLLTGSYSGVGMADFDFSRKGGVLRNHIGHIKDAIDEYGHIKRPEDLNDTAKPRTKGNLIWTLDTLRISGRADNPNSADYNFNESWGNPVGELLYEGVRYFARRAQPAGPASLQPSGSFVTGLDEVNYNNTASKHMPSGYARYFTNWNELKDQPDSTPVESGECAKPVILLISEVDSEFDGDQVRGVSPAASGLTRPALENLSATAKADLPPFDMTDYLKKITDHEYRAGGSLDAGKKYLYSTGGTDYCRPHDDLKNLDQVVGLCPNSPAFEGTYSAAAVAYYAHTHNFAPVGANSLPLDIYTVNLSGAFPELVFQLKNSQGSATGEKITILPAEMTARCGPTATNRILSAINYYVLDWRTDKNDVPYHVKIRANYEASAQGYTACQGAGAHDWDMDMVVEYTIDLVSKSCDPSKCDAAKKVALTNYNNNSPAIANVFYSGQLKVEGGDYYPFDPAKLDKKYAIDHSEVAGIFVRTHKTQGSAGTNMVAGYTITGSTHDGPYMDRGHQNANSFKYATPPTCDWPAGYGSAAAQGSSCPNPATNATAKFTATGPNVASGDGEEATSHVRTFKFSSKANDSGEILKDPLWLAAKYGGFADNDDNGRPGPGEWEGPDGNPKNYFQAANIAELPAKLEQAFKAIAEGVSTGTATSAAVNSVLGGGVSIQTLYYPEYEDPPPPAPPGTKDSEKGKIAWPGAVYGLFVDKWGNLREDTNQNGRLDLKTGKPGDTGYPLGDRVVVFTKDGEDKPVIELYDDEKGDGWRNLTPRPAPQSKPASVQKLNAVWDTSKKLAQLDKEALDSRKIFYQAKDSKGLAEFKLGDSLDLAYLAKMMVQPNTKDLLPGKYDPDTGAPQAGNFSAAESGALAKTLIRYIRGERVPGWRPREVGDPWTGGACDRTKLAGIKTIGDLPDGCRTWRLGDIINSKPIIVGSPAFNYDLLYNDRSYAAYKKKAALRRQVAYFGANDGLLHAVNLGFFGSLKDGQVGYCDKPDTSLCGGDHKTPKTDLGEERWAFLPTALLPHLQWLADPKYQHAYYVDMKPLIADMRIGGDKEDEYNGWRTVLIGGLRLGGREILDPAGGQALSYAEIFALDVTEPDKDPKLLWRYHAAELGLSVGLPLAVTRDGGQWYVALASGPAMPLGPDNEKPYDGYSDKQARIIVLDAATGKPALDPSRPENKDYLAVPEKEGKGFFNDGFLTLATKYKEGQDEKWGHTLAYYGLTVSPEGAGPACRDTGAVYRLVMGDDDPKKWELKRFVNVERPVTGAVNATRDDRGRQWVLFGTGRLWGQRDRTPCAGGSGTVYKDCQDNHTQYLYGLMEPADDDGKLTMEDLTKTSTIKQLVGAGKIIDVSEGRVYESGRVEGLGEVKGLEPTVCAPHDDAITYECLAGTISGQLGYRRALDTQGVLGTSGQRYEMILTQPKIDGLGNGRSYMAFTSYEPPTSGSLCKDDSRSYLHMVDTFTGLPAPYMWSHFLAPHNNDPQLAEGKKQVAGYQKAGGGKATEAVILHTDTGSKIMASGQNGSIYDFKLDTSETMPQGVISWREALDMGFNLTPDEMVKDLPINP